MGTLKYVGRRPESNDLTVAHKSFVDGYRQNVVVDNAYVTARANTATANMVDTDYIDDRDAGLAKKLAVTTADEDYVPVTDLARPNGVASLSARGFLPPSQLPALSTDRVPIILDTPQKFLTSKTVSSTDIKEYRAARIPVADPGWPYWPMVFATVRGRSTASADRSRRSGAGPYGRIAVIDENDDVWAGCVCAATPRLNFYEAVPHSAPKTKPNDRPACTGDTVLTLYLSLYSGDSLGFSFDDVGFKFYSIIFPAA